MRPVGDPADDTRPSGRESGGESGGEGGGFAGDGFGEAVEAYRHELQVHCYRILGSFTDAEDMVQETLLRAWRRRETFEGRSTPRAWLYRIATNACLDLLAGPARSREVTAGVGGEPRSPFTEVPWLQPYPDRLLDLAGAGQGRPDAVAVERETIELAYLAAIQHLPPRQRAVLILRDVAGWPAEETAAALELSVPAVKSALQRARATLRLHLPARRSQWRPVTAPTEEERAVLRRYMDASVAGDLSALAALLREDARQTMPPASLLYAGRTAILEMWRPVMAGPEAWGEWKALATTANRRPAVANYVRRPGESAYTAVNLDVLRVEDGLIAEITTFGPELNAVFGLPAEL
ncbi:RNA polymerase ECF family sigma subunit [Nonomuraea fuscirosea]|uniref:RNA polymerase ECF family sigma subunit n=1 Tax=Nonomuraea fuscirosea TaxID=1291556 RepID=A0A2T0MNV7_9ACTN|nr:RNA polymerase subunit sigma-70 [Nonomuraea fuscirosea]PRX59674.1 RNA polymerase ECF family sigma subunit [Nonomuraea fuscirosea]